jgi:outer membrane protein TolC
VRNECTTSRSDARYDVGQNLRMISATLAAAGLVACASYEPAPIDPARTRADFEARSLDDPRIVEHARASLPQDVAFPPAEWDLDSLTIVALEDHPDVALARADLANVRVSIITASARPNPVLVLDPEYAVNAGGGMQAWVLGAALDITFETAGKRDLRTERAERLNDAAELALFETGWRVRSRLRGALLEHVMLAREIGLLREEERLRRETLGVLQQRLAAGEISRPDLALAEIGHSQVELEIRSRESRLRETHAQLASALGMPERAITDTILVWREIDRTDALSEFDALREDALLRRLDLRRSLAEYAASEADLELEVAKQYPDVTLGPGYTYDQGAHKFLLGVSVPLPIFHQNQGPIAEAEARRKTAESRFVALQAQAIGQIETARARYSGATAELAQADASLALYRARERTEARALELGAEDRLGYSETRIQRAIFERARLDANRRVEAAFGDLEDALERTLEGRATEVAARAVHPGNGARETEERERGRDRDAASAVER